MIDKLLNQAKNLMAMPEGETKTGLIEAAKQVLFDWFVTEQITAEERQKVLDVLARDQLPAATD